MPIAIPLVGAAIAGVQAISGAVKAHAAKKALENQKSPTYAPDKAIGDYYTAALNKYNVSPYNSNMYNFNKQNAAQNEARGVAQLQDRRSALGGISSLVGQQDASNQKAGVLAEQQNNQALGQLGRATGLKAGDDRMGFNTNSMLPYQNQRGLNIAQLQGANQLTNAGIQGLSSNLQDAGKIALSNKNKSGSYWSSDDSLS